MVRPVQWGTEKGKRGDRTEWKRGWKAGGGRGGKEDGWKKEGWKRETVEDEGEERDLMVRERKDL